MASLSPPEVELLRRIAAADREKTSELHDFKDLMADDLNSLPPYWLDEAVQNFNALGLLDPKLSGATFGGPFGRLSAEGRWFLDEQDPAVARPTAPAPALEGTLDPEGIPDGAPTEEVAALRAKAFDFGYFLAFGVEPDGSFTGASFAQDGTPLQSGVADSWDDARLAIISDLFPPSGER